MKNNHEDIGDTWVRFAINAGLLLVAMAVCAIAMVEYSVVMVSKMHKNDAIPALPLAVSKSESAPDTFPKQNPLVLSLPVSHGTMTETFASWNDMQAAEQRLGLR